MNAIVRFILGAALGLAIVAPTAASAQLQTLYVFPGGPPKHVSAAAHGALPVAAPVRRGAYLYGTTQYGANGNAACGGQGCGSVFRLDPVSGKLATIYKFCAETACTDGAVPVAGLTVNATGALYGTTAGGGSSGKGTVFKLVPPAAKGGVWTETVVYSFCSLNSCADGATPRAGLSVDKNDLLYGTTNGGAQGYGTVFELDPSNGVLTTLHTFTAGTDGASPTAGVIFGKGGDLYGTTNQGAGSQTESCQAPTYPAYCGTVFKLDPTTKAFATLYTFTAQPCVGGINNCYPSGRYPFGTLVLGKSGVLFGTTSAGGTNSCGANGGCGTVFELSPPSTGHKTWSETVLWSFCGQTNCADGASPLGGLVLDRTGMLYGTASAFGVTSLPFPNNGGSGTVFELDPTSQTLTTLYTFGGMLGTCPGSCITYHANGASPSSGLAIHYSPDSAPVLYGTTEYGGGSTTNGCNGYDSDSCGTVFALTP